MTDPNPAALNQARTLLDNAQRIAEEAVDSVSWRSERERNDAVTHAMGPARAEAQHIVDTAIASDVRRRWASELAKIDPRGPGASAQVEAITARFDAEFRQAVGG